MQKRILENANFTYQDRKWTLNNEDVVSLHYMVDDGVM